MKRIFITTALVATVTLLFAVYPGNAQEGRENGPQWRHRGFMVRAMDNRPEYFADLLLEVCNQEQIDEIENSVNPPPGAAETKARLEDVKRELVEDHGYDPDSDILRAVDSEISKVDAQLKPVEGK